MHPFCPLPIHYYYKPTSKASRHPGPNQVWGAGQNEVEHVEVHNKVNNERFEKMDEFGAHAQTDPKAIALVRQVHT